MRPAGLGPQKSEISSGNSQWRVTATFISGEGRRAIINGKSYREGEMIEPGQIEKIDEGGILLRRGRRTSYLSVMPERSKFVRK
jgi:hypothetical protein